MLVTSNGYTVIRVGFLPAETYFCRTAGRNLFLSHGRQKVAETSFLSAEMITMKMGAIEHNVATGSAIEVLNV